MTCSHHPGGMRWLLFPSRRVAAPSPEHLCMSNYIVSSITQRKKKEKKREHNPYIHFIQTQLPIFSTNLRPTSTSSTFSTKTHKSNLPHPIPTLTRCRRRPAADGRLDLVTNCSLKCRSKSFGIQSVSRINLTMWWRGSPATFFRISFQISCSFSVIKTPAKSNNENMLRQEEKKAQLGVSFWFFVPLFLLFFYYYLI